MSDSLFVPDKFRHLIGKVSYDKLKAAISCEDAKINYILKHGQPTSFIKKVFNNDECPDILKTDTCKHYEIYSGICMYHGHKCSTKWSNGTMRHKYRAIINNEVKDVFYFYEAESNPQMIFVCTNFEDSSGHFIEYTDLIQCTGLQDKNGNWIWEGDTIKTPSFEATVVWYKGEFKLKVGDSFIPWDTTEQEIIK